MVLDFIFSPFLFHTPRKVFLCPAYSLGLLSPSFSFLTGCSCLYLAFVTNRPHAFGMVMEGGYLYSMHILGGRFHCRCRKRSSCYHLCNACFSLSYHEVKGD